MPVHRSVTPLRSLPGNYLWGLAVTICANVLKVIIVFHNCNIIHTEQGKREYAVLTSGYGAVLSYTGALTGIWKSTAFEFIGPCVPRPLQPRLAVTFGRATHGAARGRGHITIISARRKVQ